MASNVTAQADVAGPGSSLAGHARVNLLPLVLVTYFTFLPPQVGIAVGGIVLPAYRVLLIAALPWLVISLGKARLRLAAADVLMIGAAVWIFLALSATEGLERSLLNGGSTMVDVTISYFLARASIHTPNDLRRLLVWIAPGFALAGLSMVAETVSGRYVVQPFFIRILGSGGFEYVANMAEKRFGLIRASGVFPHPILAGLHMASLLPIYLMSRIRGWPKLVGVTAAITSILSFSSAALLMLLTQSGAMVYNRMTKFIPQLSWRLFIAGAVLAIVLVEVVTSEGAVRTLTRLAALDPWTAYYRTLIWDYGTISVKAHPWFGIGFADWPRPAWMTSDSMDNYWLLIAVQYGIPEAFCRIAVPLTGVAMLALSSAKMSAVDEDLARGLAMSVFFFTMLGFSVSLWNNTQVWFIILSGIAVTIGQFSRRADPASL